MHNSDLNELYEKIRRFLNINYPHVIIEIPQIIENYGRAQHELAIAHFTGEGNDFLLECENKLRDPSCRTAMLCLNCDDREIKPAHSVALTYDNESQNFIMKDPNFPNCESDVNLNILMTGSAVRCRYTTYHVGDALLFSKIKA